MRLAYCGLSTLKFSIKCCCQYLSLGLPQVPHKNIHKRRRDAGEGMQKSLETKLV